MQNTITSNFYRQRSRSLAFLGKGLKLGFTGGLSGTFVMDAVLIVVLMMMGESPWTCFSIVGNTMATFFNFRVVEVANFISIGVAAHYLIGPVVGIIFGMFAASLRSYRSLSYRKRIFVAVIFIQILSQPLLASAPLLLDWNVSITLLWFGISLFMHLIMGIILGVIVSKGFVLPMRTVENHSYKVSR